MCRSGGTKDGQGEEWGVWQKQSCCHSWQFCCRRLPLGSIFGASKGHSLEPDLAGHGALADKDAALVVEYDGFWRHAEKKNVALLECAPEGSFVVRFSHTMRKPLSQKNTLWITVDAWQQGHHKHCQGLCRVYCQRCCLTSNGYRLRPLRFAACSSAAEVKSTVVVQERAEVYNGRCSFGREELQRRGLQLSCH